MDSYNSNDLFAQKDEDKGIGHHGRVYKVALREVEGSFKDFLRPSFIGLPPRSKTVKAWPPRIPSNLPPEVSAKTCADMVAHLLSYA